MYLMSNTKQYFALLRCSNNPALTFSQRSARSNKFPATIFNVVSLISTVRFVWFVLSFSIFYDLFLKNLPDG